MTNEQLLDLLKATIDTSGGQGIASAEDANEFIDLAIDQTPVLQTIRNERDIVNSRNLDSLFLAEPVTTADTEGVAPGAADVVAPAQTRRTLSPVTCVSAFDVSFDFLRRNIAGERVNDQLNALFAKRVGKDIVHLAFMGDTATSPVTTRTDKLLDILDGFVVQAVADANVHDYTIPGSPSYSTVVFPAMLAALPKDYRDQRSELGLFCSADVYDAYADELITRETILGDNVLAGPWGENLAFKGVALHAVYGMATNRIILTLRDNLVIGWGGEITIGRDIDNRAGLLKVTMRPRVDVKIVEGDALVLGQ